ncbi:uncharacterized protein LOC134832492 [Culicoides brevitarsis]|uniref:uncharacterized protein LOC134832492 n=1 Tax=Culicoides brevitarsis TaxID=469753 RepID=UPI00307BDEE5
MKFVLFLTVVLKITLADDMSSLDDTTQMFNKSLESCLKKNPNVSKETIMTALTTVFKEPITPEVKCILHCIGKDMGEMNDDGVIIVEKSLQNVPANMNKDVVKTIEEECITLMGTDKCDTAFLQFKCISEKAIHKKDDLVKKS